jgi:hypothetical protein
MLLTPLLCEKIESMSFTICIHYRTRADVVIAFTVEIEFFKELKESC